MSKVIDCDQCCTDPHLRAAACTPKPDLSKEVTDESGTSGMASISEAIAGVQ